MWMDGVDWHHVAWSGGLPLEIAVGTTTTTTTTTIIIVGFHVLLRKPFPYPRQFRTHVRVLLPE